MKTSTILNVDDKKVEVSNLDKVMYPQTGFTKGDMIKYYIDVASSLLPHLRKRPITLKRYPNGVEGMFFYEKQCPAHRPDWIATTKVDRSDGTQIDYCVIDDLPSLVWAVNLADLEFHVFLHKATALTRPTVLAFDLDPGPPADIKLCCQVGIWIRETFDRLGLKAFPKTSGSKGLQVYVPLNSSTTYDKTKEFALAIAQLLQETHPNTVVSKMQKNLRDGKVFVDWSQNDDHKTTICVYSLRAKPHPTVSTPMTWDEVESFLKRRAKGTLAFEATDVIKRIGREGDLFAPVLTLKQSLPSLKSLKSVSVKPDFGTIH